MIGLRASTLTQSIAIGGTKRRCALTSAPSGSSSPARPLPAPPGISCHHCTARGRCSQGRAPYINTIILPSLMANLSMPCAAAAAANGAQTSTHLAGGMET